MAHAVIHIPENLLAAITQAAEAAFPKECCGLLVGHEDGTGDFTLTRIEASPNLAEGEGGSGGRDRFLVDPKIHFDLMRQLGDGPEQIIGNYHSHPGPDARPSEHDRQSAFYPGHVWVIVAVPEGKTGDITAQRFDAETKQFCPMELATP